MDVARKHGSKEEQMNGSLLAGVLTLMIAGCSDHQDTQPSTPPRGEMSRSTSGAVPAKPTIRCGYVKNDRPRRSRHQRLVRYERHERLEQQRRDENDVDGYVWYVLGLGLLAGVVGYRHRDAIG
jgi:hypothetical protein